jgi:hypothetical protein
VVAPAFRNEIAKLSKIVAAHLGCPAALFGHCDPAGTDELNKTLGDRRAIAIYALLTRQCDLWASIYDNPAVGDTWGTKAIQCMLSNLADDEGAHYYSGKIDGDYGSGTTAAVSKFQSDASTRKLSDGSYLSPTPIAATGKADPTTRNLLFTAYMDWLCTPPPTSDDDSTPPDAPSPPVLKMDPTDFLGGPGATKGALPKMSLQGCSEFNPVVLLTASEMKASGDTTVRNEDDAPNRRVVMFFFKKGTKVEPAAWPCPKVKEPLAGCKKAFWPDGETRRKSGSEERKYSDTRDTMACRFYDRFARRSKCEISTILNIWLFDLDRQRMPGAKYRIVVGGETTIDYADDQGLLTVSAPPTAATCNLEWGELPNTASSDPVFKYFRELNVSRSPADPEARDLDNLAYAGSTLDERREAFKMDYIDPPTNVTDVRAKVIDVHDNGTPKGSRR